MLAMASRVSLISGKGIAHLEFVGNPGRLSGAHMATRRTSRYGMIRCIMLDRRWLVVDIVGQCGFFDRTNMVWLLVTESWQR
jgi:hypothetical protein